MKRLYLLIKCTLLLSGQALYAQNGVVKSYTTPSLHYHPHEFYVAGFFGFAPSNILGNRKESMIYGASVGYFLLEDWAVEIGAASSSRRLEGVWRLRSSSRSARISWTRLITNSYLLYSIGLGYVHERQRLTEFEPNRPFVDETNGVVGNADLSLRLDKKFHWRCTLRAIVPARR